MDYYPYFVYPLIEELKKDPDSPDASRLKMLIAANVADRDALARLIGNPDGDLRNFYPDQLPSSPSTDETIDAFIAKYGSPSSIPAELEELSRFPDSAVETKAPAPQHPKIGAPTKKNAGRFPKSVDAPKTPEPKPAEKVDDPKASATQLSLQSVKDLVKKRDYAGALEIMEAIYLNNPKKSIYFADQIRFIKKLMVNESKKQH